MLQYLPENRLFWPPLTIRCIECRSFGRQLLVGVCTMDRLADYEWKDKTGTDVAPPPTLAAIANLQTTDAGQLPSHYWPDPAVT